MNTKEATIQMLTKIRVHIINNENPRVKDKDIAKMLKLTPASFSRLITGVSEPKLQSWINITKLHAQYYGDEETNMIINNVS